MTLLARGAAVLAASLPITWYAAAPLLCLVPFIFLMLSFGEEERASWLPLVTLIKALGVPALVMYAAITVPDALRFARGDSFALLGTVLAAILIAGCDVAVAVSCYRRSRALCK